MSKAGRKPIFKEKVHKATGLTMAQYEWMKEEAANIDMSQMALFRCAVSLLMQRMKEPMSSLSKEEMKDVLSRLQK